MPYKVYDAQLRQLGILIKAKNFLVFQGDVDAIASKGPLEITKFFEEISGSSEMRQAYEKAKKECDEAGQKLVHATTLAKALQRERIQIRQQVGEADRFKEKHQELLNMKREFYLWQLWHLEAQLVSQVYSLIDLTS